MGKKRRVKKMASGSVIEAVKHGTTQSQKSLRRDDERAKKIMENMIGSNAVSKFGEYLKITPVRNPTALQELFQASSAEAAQNVGSDKKDKKSEDLKKGGVIRGHGCEQRGKTRGRFV